MKTVYATLTNGINSKSTRVVVRDGTINARQCNDAINRIKTQDGAFRLISDIPVKVDSAEINFGPQGMRITDTPVNGRYHGSN